MFVMLLDAIATTNKLRISPEKVLARLEAAKLTRDQLSHKSARALGLISEVYK
jgi:hypothetical protein